MASELLIKVAFFAAIIGIAYSVGLYEQCAGEGYANFPCNAGLICFRRNRYFSSCQYSCPLGQGWECEIYLTASPTPIPTIAAAWGQCGGDGWYGARTCGAGFACYARTNVYAQCRPVNDCPTDWACYGAFLATSTTPRPVGPVILTAYTKCNDVVNAVCQVGLGCFRYNAAHAECRPYCPAGWSCETDFLAAGEQCGGDGYVGITRCGPGFACYARTNLYAQCRPVNDCPYDWGCYSSFLATSTTPRPVGPVILTAYAKCNDVVNSVCQLGLGCFRRDGAHAECRPYCPAGWFCETDVLAAGEQCGGDDYVGVTRCAPGLTCYARSRFYAHCADVCPGVDWNC